MLFSFVGARMNTNWECGSIPALLGAYTQGLILESGLDWVENDEIKKLVLALGDDAADSSDEEGGLMLDEAHGAQEEESDDGSEGESDM